MTDPSGLCPAANDANHMCFTEGPDDLTYNQAMEFEWMNIPVVPQDAVTQIGPNGQLQIWNPGVYTVMLCREPDQNGDPTWYMQKINGGWSNVPLGSGTTLTNDSNWLGPISYSGIRLLENEEQARR